MKFLVTRMDILSRKSYPINELIRLKKADDTLVLDIDHSMKGRGIYLHKDKETIDIAYKKHLLKRYIHNAEQKEMLFKEMMKIAQ